MKIENIDKIQIVKKIKSAETLPCSSLQDTLSISSTAQKKGVWVAMLEGMPDIRPEKIEAALNSAASPSLYALAEKILNTL